ncbi:hypothetical protein EWP20_11550 [Neisseria meningitidis]|nr:hypothetical protein [Neisseria meningitidis]MBG8594833.1 hypothetical protein [Neisseria meningitidis]MBG8603600.1 hypothetical protein [Neisseria meningitidis]MBG8605894.1 hypothetical protein [Neisseria meningitidis]MBG8610315.1 hypothetical protein [Neisseria meningitidis]
MFNFQTTFPSFETGYWELSSSKILSPSLIRRCFSQNGRRLQSHCPYSSRRPRPFQGRGKRRNGIQTRYHPIR